MPKSANEQLNQMSGLPIGRTDHNNSMLTTSYPADTTLKDPGIRNQDLIHELSKYDL